MSDLASTVATLDLRLREWKASVPKRYRPDVQETPSFPDSRVAILFISLHFSYFNCLLSIHRVIVSRGPDINIELARYSNGLLSDDIALFSGILCQNAARASIKLMKHMPDDNPFIAGYVRAIPTTLHSSLADISRTIAEFFFIILSWRPQRFPKTSYTILNAHLGHGIST